mmetsp:Transcript_7355/g.21714  ORF Transcript_7355/g.21714 Transcript_7355/m.21714 type:complete len:216 (-) Transcript_7355:499-1146(-)
MVVVHGVLDLGRRVEADDEASPASHSALAIWMRSSISSSSSCWASTTSEAEDLGTTGDGHLTLPLPLDCCCSVRPRRMALEFPVVGSDSPRELSSGGGAPPVLARFSGAGSEDPVNPPARLDFSRLVEADLFAGGGGPFRMPSPADSPTPSTAWRRSRTTEDPLRIGEGFLSANGPPSNSTEWNGFILWCPRLLADFFFAVRTAGLISPLGGAAC